MLQKLIRKTWIFQLFSAYSREGHGNVGVCCRVKYLKLHFVVGDSKQDSTFNITLFMISIKAQKGLQMFQILQYCNQKTIGDSTFVGYLAISLTIRIVSVESADNGLRMCTLPIQGLVLLTSCILIWFNLLLMNINDAKAGLDHSWSLYFILGAFCLVPLSYISFGLNQINLDFPG